jgi:hypothetical protein
VEAFRLLNRVLIQKQRISKIRGLDRLGKTVVEAARQSSVIGQLWTKVASASLDSHRRIPAL